VIVIAGAAIATAPDRHGAHIVQQALSAVPVASVTDPGVLRSKLDITGLLGPAALAYLDAADFRPKHGLAVVDLLDARDPALRRFVSGADAADLGESGVQEITSPAFVIRERNQIIAAAGYRDWPGQVAHLSVLTAAHARGRGLARATASAAVSHALAENKLPQWRARPEVSRRIARSLGFRGLGSQIGIRLGDGKPAGQRAGE
jgi:hypothetical protein